MHARRLYLLESPKQPQNRLVQDTVRLMEIAEPGKILAKHLPGQEPEPFIGQAEQFGARRRVSLAHAVKQLLQLLGSIVRHGRSSLVVNGNEGRAFRAGG